MSRLCRRGLYSDLCGLYPPLGKYHPVVRATVLNGFLAYVFYAGAILLDLGRWWNIINPIRGEQIRVNWCFPCLLALPALYDFPVY